MHNDDEAYLEIVLTGNPVKGFVAYGPFDTTNEATSWALTEMSLNPDWWVLKLQQPRTLIQTET